jgi:hypothetical protein
VVGMINERILDMVLSDIKIFEVPEILALPAGLMARRNVVDFADMMLTSLFSHAPAMLHAEYRPGNRMVTWFVRPTQAMDGEPGLPVGVTEFSTGCFRAVLARFGHRYMNDQLYGGHKLCVLHQRGRANRCHIYMANNGQSGFWIKIYVAVISGEDGTEAGPVAGI